MLHLVHLELGPSEHENVEISKHGGRPRGEGKVTGIERTPSHGILTLDIWIHVN